MRTVITNTEVQRALSAAFELGVDDERLGHAVITGKQLIEFFNIAHHRNVLVQDLKRLYSIGRFHQRANTPQGGGT